MAFAIIDKKTVNLVLMASLPKNTWVTCDKPFKYYDVFP